MEEGSLYRRRGVGGRVLDGQFELRDFRQTSSWCTLTTYETASGQFRADQANVTLYPSQGHIISKNDCRADWNYERDGASVLRLRSAAEVL